MAIIIATISVVILIGIAWLMGWFVDLGYMILNNCFPTTYPSKNDQVDVYINGEWNRRATVTACGHSYIALYSAVRCPVDYRGRFYAIGEDANGNILVYLDEAKHWHLVKRAELIRKIFGVPGDYGTFTPVDESKSYDAVFSGIKYPADEVPEVTEEGMP